MKRETRKNDTRLCLYHRLSSSGAGEFLFSINMTFILQEMEMMFLFIFSLV